MCQSCADMGHWMISMYVKMCFPQRRRKKKWDSYSLMNQRSLFSEPKILNTSDVWRLKKWMEKTISTH